jgi:deoxyribodipyrimidine photo-lyase
MATEAAESVIVVFIFDTVILDELQDKYDTRVTFIHQSLNELDEKLRGLGSRLVCDHGDPSELVPQLASKFGAEAVFASHDFDPYALERDRTVKSKLKEIGVDFRTCKDHVIFQKNEVLNQQGLPFRVYTPYSKAWRARFVASEDANMFEPNVSHLAKISEIPELPSIPSLENMGFKFASPWIAAGENAAQQRLSTFRSKMKDYKDLRDFPAVEGTSALSAHLRFGTISVREVIRAAIEDGTAGGDKWMAEVIWRDFYHDILGNFPHVVDQTFSPQFREIEWAGSDESYQAWEDGKTGYPIVDAGMRCLNQTGWMHNRLRMIVASFLTKDLLVDYRRGEAHFARKLLDFDLAQNNGGWQWAASVGCDAQPYFRIFNPYLQSKKFDPDGGFIRAWVPELATLSNDAIHEPSMSDCNMLGYPLPMVDHMIVKQRAVQMFESAKAKHESSIAGSAG